MLVLSEREVEALLDSASLIDALERAMGLYSTGEILLPPRTVVPASTGPGLLGVMPASVPEMGFLGAKLVSVFPGNEGATRPTHQAVVIHFDPENGVPLALIAAGYLTAARTAAGSALATRWLARRDASTLAIVGTGVQARAHARAIPLVREIEGIRIWGRNPQKAASLAREIERETGVVTETAASFSDAAIGADIICAATHAAEPVVVGRLLAPGVHLNSVGLNPGGRELDDDVIRRALIFIESREAAFSMVGAGAADLRRPCELGLIKPEGVAEIGEVIVGKRTGRAGRESITVYKSVGIALQDGVAAELVYRAARKRGLGREVGL